MSVVTILLEAGACLHYPDDASGDAYAKRLLKDASPAVANVLREAMTQ